VPISYIDAQGVVATVDSDSQEVTKLNNGQAVFSITGASTPNAPVAGNILTATNTTADPDGNGVFSFVWQTSTNGTTWSPAGTNSSTYTVAAADAGKQIKLVVTYLDAKVFSESVTTAAGTVPFLQPAVTLAVSPASVLEDGVTNLVYTFTRTGVTANSLTVNYTVGGTATLGTELASPRVV